MNKKLSDKAITYCNRFNYNSDKIGLFYALKVSNNNLSIYVKEKFNEPMSLLNDSYILRNMTIKELENLIL